MQDGNRLIINGRFVRYLTPQDQEQLRYYEAQVSYWNANLQQHIQHVSRLLPLLTNFYFISTEFESNDTIYDLQALCRCVSIRTSEAICGDIMSTCIVLLYGSEMRKHLSRRYEIPCQ